MPLVCAIPVSVITMRAPAAEAYVRTPLFSKADFKAWVEHGRNPLKRAAHAASTVARAEAVERARAQPLLPTRFRGCIRLESASTTVALRVGATGAVSVTLGVVAHPSEATLLQWHKRAAQVVDRCKWRRDAAEAAAATLPWWSHPPPLSAAH